MLVPILQERDMVSVAVIRPVSACRAHQALSSDMQFQVIGTLWYHNFIPIIIGTGIGRWNTTQNCQPTIQVVFYSSSVRKGEPREMIIQTSQCAAIQ